MIIKTLFKNYLKESLKALALIFAVMALYELVIIYMFDPQLAQTLDQYQKTMPELMKAFGMSGNTENLTAFMENYLYGMIMLVLPYILSLIIIYKDFYGSIERGTIAGVLSMPCSRRSLISTVAFTVIVSHFILCLMTIVCGLVGAQLMFPGQLDCKAYVEINLVTMLFQLMIASIVMLAGVLADNSKVFFLLGGGVPLLCYIFDMLAGLGDKMSFFRYLTLNSLLVTDRIVAGESILVQNLAMIIVAGVALVLAAGIFENKDLNI